MDWSQHAIPAMRLEPRFGDRIVPAFCERPSNYSGDGGRRRGAKPGRRGAGLRRRAADLARSRAAIGADRGRVSKARPASAATASRCCSATGPNSC